MGIGSGRCSSAILEASAMFLLISPRHAELRWEPRMFASSYSELVPFSNFLLSDLTTLLCSGLSFIYPLTENIVSLKTASAVFCLRPARESKQKHSSEKETTGFSLNTIPNVGSVPLEERQGFSEF